MQTSREQGYHMQLNKEAGFANPVGNTLYRDYKHPEGGGYGDTLSTGTHGPTEAAAVPHSLTAGRLRQRRG